MFQLETFLAPTLLVGDGRHSEKSLAAIIPSASGVPSHRFVLWFCDSWLVNDVGPMSDDQCLLRSGYQSTESLDLWFQSCQLSHHAADLLPRLSGRRPLLTWLTGRQCSRCAWIGNLDWSRNVSWSVLRSVQDIPRNRRDCRQWGLLYVSFHRCRTPTAKQLDETHRRARCRQHHGAADPEAMAPEPRKLMAWLIVIDQWDAGTMQDTPH